jgi:hypothetical protein
MKQRMKVFVPGPYTDPKPEVVLANVYEAMLVGEELWKNGFDPEIVHLFHWWDAIRPKPYEAWMEMTTNRLYHCAAVYLALPESNGVKLELAAARRWAIPIFRDLQNLIDYREESWKQDETF